VLQLDHVFQLVAMWPHCAQETVFRQ
jgi:hypothetical protein